MTIHKPNLLIFLNIPDCYVSSLSELTTIIFNIELTQLDLEASI